MFTKRMRKRIFTVAVMAASILAGPALADSVAKGSAGSLLGSVSVVDGSFQIAGASGGFVVDSVAVVGEITFVTLKSASTGVKYVLQLTGDIAKNAAWVAGKALEGVGTAAGTILSAGGETVAFVPNAVGQSITHSSTY